MGARMSQPSTDNLTFEQSLAELDRIVGSAYAYSEQYFRPAMTIGYESKFRR